MAFKLWERFQLYPIPSIQAFAMNTYVPTPGPPPPQLAFGKERPKLSAQSWVYWGATGFVKGPQEPVGAVGVTRKGSKRCGRRGVRESPYRRACPPSPGSWCSPAAGPLPEAVAAGNKEPARPRLPGLRNPGPSATAGVERKSGHASRFAAVRGGGWRPRRWCGPRGRCLLPRRARQPGCRCFSPPTRESGFTTLPGGAWPSAAGDRSSAPAAKPWISLQDSESTGLFPEVSWSFVWSSWGSPTVFAFNKKFL